MALPIRILTGDGARVALQRCPILRAGTRNSSTARWSVGNSASIFHSHFEWVFT
jgi:hypothetical protein